MNVILLKFKAVQELAKYFHDASFFPTSKILKNTTKRNRFVSWPRLTADLIQKHLPLSIPTAKYYFNQEKKGIRSNKTVSIPQNENNSDDYYPSTPNPNGRTYDELTVLPLLTTKYT